MATTNNTVLIRNLNTLDTNFKSNLATGTNFTDKENNLLGKADPSSSYNSLQEIQDEKDKLNKILLTRKRMLDVNIERNETKNKIIYSMFSFIILLIFIITIIYYQVSN